MALRRERMRLGDLLIKQNVLTEDELKIVKVDVDEDYSILDNKPKAKPKATPKKKQKSKFSFLKIFGGGR